jgi:hypothetical protein
MDPELARFDFVQGRLCPAQVQDDIRFKLL